ncbi:hypothetical protein M0R88_14135 [Halorussus gelatinilyticus]|uniref:Uncharacterized protein n=1 Tax=Halorussus gelatinilyticus TaxID=2937524 RepID=A0A8U0IHU6_9EURY|nr:hypothetical protein [Halorussus gelatinilyticus]UPV99648.1 hypothetical protein M0R88_14135 [Halorussus gelatinilyticus]
MEDDGIEAVLDGDESVSDLDDEQIEAVLDDIDDAVARIDATIESLNRHKRTLREKADELRTFQKQRELFPEDAVESLDNLVDTVSTLESEDDADGATSLIGDETDRRE